MQQISTQGSKFFKSCGHHDMGRVFRQDAGYMSGSRLLRVTHRENGVAK